MNPFLAHDFEKALADLTRGPMTSDQRGVLIRPVDQMAEAVRVLHGERKTHVVEVARYRAALNTLPCACKRLLITTCPQCGGRLEAVTYPSDSMLNRDQFDSVRAGDWYCTNCKGVEASSGYKYWWNSDLGKSNQQCPRCAALAAHPTAAVEAIRELIHATYEVIGGVRARRAVFPDAPPSKVAIARLDAALAAYEEATRG